MQPHHLTRSSVEEATEAAERAAARASQVYHGAPVESKQQLDAMFMTHRELDSYMIEVKRNRCQQSAVSFDFNMISGLSSDVVCACFLTFALLVFGHIYASRAQQAAGLFNSWSRNQSDVLGPSLE